MQPPSDFCRNTVANVVRASAHTHSSSVVCIAACPPTGDCGCLQELIAAKGRRLQQSEQRLINTLYPTAEHVRARQHEILTMQEQALAAQVEAKQREATSAALLSRAVHKDAMDQSHIRPWTAATISYQSDEEERQARRHFSHQLAADNLKLMAERALQRQQQVVQETQQERSAIASEVSCRTSHGPQDSCSLHLHCTRHRFLACYLCVTVLLYC